jgi:O-glycosyl hydrolase
MQRRFIAGASALLVAAATTTTLLPAAPVAATATPLAVVNPDVPYVEDFQGFGTSLAWGATVVGTWSDANRAAIADALFGTSGLKLRIARYWVGSGQNPDPDGAGCLALRTGADPASFHPTSTSWDWNADPGQRWFLDAAIDRGVQTTEAVFSSPPHWMTVSGCTNGHSDGAQSNVPNDRLDDYADYMAEVTEHFANNYQMPFDSVAPMNEPFDDWWDKDTADHAGTHLTQAQQNDLILALKQSLQDRSLGTGISAPDANHTEDALAGFQNYSQAARDALTQVNTHTYHYVDPKGNYSSLAPLHNKVADAGKKLWMSEFGTSAYEFQYRNTVTGALNLGARITHDLNALRPDGWVFWDGIESLRENRDSYPDENGVPVGTSWGLIYADYEDPEAETWYKVKMYHGMKQYSRYLEPGMDIIASGDSNTVAGFNPDTGRLVLVVMNRKSTARSVGYDLSHFNLPSATSAVYRTTDSLDAATQPNIAITSSTLNDQLPAKSITTYVIDGASNANQPSAIVSSLSGKCASVSDWSTADGAALVQWECSDGSANQLWNLQSAGNGLYQLRSSLSGKCASVADWSMDDGAALVQWTCGTGSANQLWRLDSAPGQRAYLRSSLSGKCASVADSSMDDGAGLVQWDCGGASATNQLWELGDAEVHEPSLLVSELSGKCASVSDWSTTDGAALVQWTCGADSGNQQWLLEQDLFHVRSIHSDKCASVSDWSTTDGAALVQWTCGTGSANQLWDLQSVDGGAYLLRNVHSGKCASVADWSTTDGAALVQWTCNPDSANQRWRLE